MSRVLLVSHDYVRKAMAGPAIRAFELCRELQRAGNDVTLAVPGSTDLEGAPFELAAYDRDLVGPLEALARDRDVLIIQGFTLHGHPALRASGARLVVEMYDPFHFEYLATVVGNRQPEDQRLWRHVLGALDEQLRVGDFFTCASERQRDLWLGFLSALNRIDHQTYADDAELRRLIDVVPFGLTAEPPRRSGAPGLRQALGLSDDDFVLLWGGGVYNWFDPLTLIRGVAEAAREEPRVRLVFIAASHPNPEIPAMDMLRHSMALADELGVRGRSVLFNDRWVAYEERADWWLDADVGVSTHYPHVETRFAFRTRMLDYVWAGLPILCTTGDFWSETVAREQLGLVVPFEDAGAVRDAVLRMVRDRAFRDGCAGRVRAYASGLTWADAARPLVRYCGDPRPAPDLAGLRPQQARTVPLRSNRQRAGAIRKGPDQDRDRPLLRPFRRAAELIEEEGALGPVRGAARRAAKLRRRLRGAPGEDAPEGTARP